MAQKPEPFRLKVDVVKLSNLSTSLQCAWAKVLKFSLGKYTASCTQLPPKNGCSVLVFFSGKGQKCALLGIFDPFCTTGVTLQLTNTRWLKNGDKDFQDGDLRMMFALPPCILWLTQQQLRRRGLNSSWPFEKTLKSFARNQSRKSFRRTPHQSCSLSGSVKNVAIKSSKRSTNPGRQRNNNYSFYPDWDCT